MYNDENNLYNYTYRKDGSELSHQRETVRPGGQPGPQGPAQLCQGAGQHVEENHEAADGDQVPAGTFDSLHEGGGKGGGLTGGKPWQFLPPKGFPAAPEEKARQQGREHVDEPQIGPRPGT